MGSATRRRQTLLPLFVNCFWFVCRRIDKAREDAKCPYKFTRGNASAELLYWRMQPNEPFSTRLQTHSLQTDLTEPCYCIENASKLSTVVPSVCLGSQTHTDSRTNLHTRTHVRTPHARHRVSFLVNRFGRKTTECGPSFLIFMKSGNAIHCVSRFPPQNSSEYLGSDRAESPDEFTAKLLTPELKSNFVFPAFNCYLR